jgi:hypothetical protein
MRRLRHLVAGILCGAALAGTAAAQSPGNIEIELNTAADVEGGCRLTYVITNSSLIALDEVSYEVAVYDTDGIVKKLLVLEFGLLPGGKTRVVQFDLADQPCAGVSRILVNGPVECLGGGAEQTICRDNQILSSRVGGIQFN